MVTSVSYTCGKKLTKDGKSYGIRKEGRDEASAAKGACSYDVCTGRGRRYPKSRCSKGGCVNM